MKISDTSLDAIRCALMVAMNQADSAYEFAFLRYDKDEMGRYTDLKRRFEEALSEVIASQ